MADPDTGMEVFKAVYKAGFINRWHTHPCAHGIYVLDGTLVTHQGSYPAGSFV
jgi:quercetin dioxygenase-like cupin family protein